jgi:hypothetical protein
VRPRTARTRAPMQLPAAGLARTVTDAALRAETCRRPGTLKET